jgi:hypothetical protein
MMNKKFRPVFASVAAIVASASWAANPGQLLISGPIESIDSSHNTVTVLGHSVTLAHVDSVQVGQLVRVYGSIGGGAALGTAQLQNLGTYANGYESLYLKGTVSAVTPSIARLRVGGAEVDYTALLANGRFAVPGVGTVVEIAGVLPSGHGLLLASSLRPVAGLGVTGSGAPAGVTGSGSAVGVTGSGAPAGVTGSGSAVGVTGSGAPAGVTGSGSAVGVTGSGAPAGVTGSGSAVGVTGSGAPAGITGSGAPAL